MTETATTVTGTAHATSGRITTDMEIVAGIPPTKAITATGNNCRRDVRLFRHSRINKVDVTVAESHSVR
jgi:hypothetical protein